MTRRPRLRCDRCRYAMPIGNAPGLCAGCQQEVAIRAAENAPARCLVCGEMTATQKRRRCRSCARLKTDMHKKEWA